MKYLLLFAAAASSAAAVTIAARTAAAVRNAKIVLDFDATEGLRRALAAAQYRTLRTR